MKPSILNKYPSSKLVFLHLPKSAGTSIVKVLSDEFDESLICPFNFDHEILRCKPIELNKYSFFWGHYFRQGVETIPGFKLVFTAVRNPIDRIRSMYKFWNYIDDKLIDQKTVNGPRFAKTYDFKSFLNLDITLLHQFGVDSYFLRCLSGLNFHYSSISSKPEFRGLAMERARNGIDEMSYILSMETLDEDFKHLFLTLTGKEFSKDLPRERDSRNVGTNLFLSGQKNRSTYKQKDVELYYGDSEVERRLEELTALDMVLYQYARASKNSKEFNVNAF